MTGDSQAAATQPANSFVVQQWIGRGIELQNAGKFRDALSCFVRALELNPDQMDVWYKVGVCWQSLGHFEDAIASYKTCYRRSQARQHIWFQGASQLCLGQCYFHLQQPDSAVSAYSLAYQLFSQLENHPQTRQAWDSLSVIGNNFLNNKKFQEATLFYQKLLKIVKTTRDRRKLGWVWHGLGRGFSGEGLDELAGECHRQMLEISRELSDCQMEGTALYWSAWGSWKRGKLADAIADYERAIAVCDQWEEGKTWIAVILDYLENLYQKTENFEKAIAVLERRLAIVREGRDKRGEFKLLEQIAGLYYHQLKDYRRAFDSYHSALEVAQGWAERRRWDEAKTYFMLGLTCQHLNRFDGALSNYREASKLYAELGHQGGVDSSRRRILELEDIVASRSSGFLSKTDPQLEFLLNVLKGTEEGGGVPEAIELSDGQLRES